MRSRYGGSGGRQMYAGEVTIGLRESTAVARAWRATISDHLPYGRLVLLAIATLCDQRTGSLPGEDVRAQVSGMTGLNGWKVSEVLRVLLRDGHVVERHGQLSVA